MDMPLVSGYLKNPCERNSFLVMLIIAPKGLSKKMELIDFFFSKRPDDGNNDDNDFFFT